MVVPRWYLNGSSGYVEGMRLLPAMLAVCAVVAGCSLPRSVTGTSVGGAHELDAFVPPVDTGADAGPPVDAWSPIDAWSPMPDAYVAPDAYVEPDAYVAPDAYVPPDAYVAPDAWAPPSCDSLYMTAQQYYRCDEQPTQCLFLTHLTSNHSCDDACALGHGGCTAAYWPGPASNRCYPPGSDDGCGTQHSDHWSICVCAR